jgi:hypothetical protein
VAGVVCFRTGARPHFFYRLHIWRGRKGEHKTSLGGTTAT